MKKFIFFGLLFLLLTIVSNLSLAAPVGNPASPKLLTGKWVDSEDYSIKAGAEADIVLDGKLKEMDDVESSFYLGKLSVTLANKVDLYGMLGAAYGEYEETYGSDIVKYETETDIAWGIGSTVLLYESDNGIMVGMDTKYRSLEADLDKIIVNGTTYDIPSGDVTDASIEYMDWQVALGAAYALDMFVPYGGVKYSDVDAKLKTTVSGTTYESDSVEREDNFGIFVGCDILPLENLSLNVEGRFIDEEAVNFGGTLKF